MSCRFAGKRLFCDGCHFICIPNLVYSRLPAGNQANDRRHDGGQATWFSVFSPKNMECATMNKNEQPGRAPLTAKECGEQARDCLREANRTHAEPRAAWLKMAARWLDMADNIRLVPAQA